MPSRLTELALVVLVATLVSNLLLYALEGSSSIIAGGPYGTVAGTLGFFAVFAFASYEALAIRKALAVRLYKSQALGIGLVALALILLTSFQLSVVPFLPPNTGPFGTPINYPFIYFAWLVLFYWIDASIRAARRSDPLLRDTLRWSRVRIAVWTVMVASIILTSSIVLYQVTVTGLSIFAQLHLPFGGPQGALNLLSFFPPVIFGAIYVPLSAYRSKDPTLRRHLAWFGLFLLSFVALLISFSLPFKEVASLAASEIIVLAGYFLYQSARSLVPLNRISPD